MTSALTIGTWDPVHVDHVLFLRRCEELADVVNVGVNSDSFIQEYRGGPPLFNEKERVRQITNLGYPALINDGPGWELIKSVNPDFLVVGSDWLEKDYLAQVQVGQQLLHQLNLAVVFFPYGQNISSSEIRERCRQTS